MISDKSVWGHQDEAVHRFLEAERGILEMATGTGKTRTAMRIIRELFETGRIDQVVITAFGNDLLDQWYQELLLDFYDVSIYRWYGKYQELSRFQMRPGRGRILLLMRDGERMRTVLDKMDQKIGEKCAGQRTLLIFDEVHGAGSKEFREKVSGALTKYRYCLGLSATPIREFDETGTQFIRSEIGPVIYTFGLREAIQKGILCGFDYETIRYELTNEEKNQKKKIIAAYEMKRKLGHIFEEEEMYRELARINKLAVNKLPLFSKFVSQNPSVLERCIIFVETREYGLKLQKVLLAHTYNFHTYYGEDDYKNLVRFSQGKLQCLITCRKISEGIDIQSVKNIVLFSSDRGRLATTQRIGRSLRRDPADAEKRALVVDFIYSGGGHGADDVTADMERERWLKELSEVRREDFCENL